MRISITSVVALFLSLVGLAVFQSCEPTQIEADSSEPQGIQSFEVYAESRASLDIAVCDTVYVPIYSDIYTTTIHHRFNLTATLSIRNTSLEHAMYIDNIDYYDSHGELVREYVDSMLILRPMSSIEFVIEEDDTAGGTGANFIVDWCAEHTQVYPVLQGVMISTHGQQGISFITDGVSIKRR